MLRVAAQHWILCRTGLLLWKAGDMKEIVIASPVTQQLADFSEALGQTSGLKMIHCHSVAETLTRVAKPTVMMLIVDTRLGAEEAKQLIRDTLMVNGHGAQPDYVLPHDGLLEAVTVITLRPGRSAVTVSWEEGLFPDAGVYYLNGRHVGGGNTGLNGSRPAKGGMVVIKIDQNRYKMYQRHK